MPINSHGKNLTQNRTKGIIIIRANAIRSNPVPANTIPPAKLLDKNAAITSAIPDTPNPNTKAPNVTNAAKRHAAAAITNPIQNGEDIANSIIATIFASLFFTFSPDG